MTSSVDAPIEPVAPRIVICRLVVHRAHRSAYCANRAAAGIAAQQRVDAVEHAAVARQELPAVLDAALALEQRLEQIADDRQRRQGKDQRDPARKRRQDGKLACVAGLRRESQQARAA